MLSKESYAELVIKQLLQRERVSGKDCCGKCPKLANYTTIQENVHHLSTGNYLVSCNLPPDGRSSKEASSQTSKKMPDDNWGSSYCGQSRPIL